MTNEKRLKGIAYGLLAVAIASFFIGLSDATLGLFDFDLGFVFFGDFDNESDLIAWMILLGTFPAFIFNLIAIYNIDLLLKKTSLGTETFINYLLIFFVPFYQLYYIYKRLDYLATLNHPLGDKKFLYVLLAFFGLNTIAFALTHDEIVMSEAYRSSGESVLISSYQSQQNVEEDLSDISDELTKLKKLLEDDLIDQNDYNKMKDKLLK